MFCRSHINSGLFTELVCEEISVCFSRIIPYGLDRQYFFAREGLLNESCCKDILFITETRIEIPTTASDTLL